mmetsp:Transcript_44477/g.139488  ORF Transcript_44477/g.139488 Transcript_44477/m.139488 type:complete len:284 (-) Transcript_44477:602-1453(-)
MPLANLALAVFGAGRAAAVASGSGSGRRGLVVAGGCRGADGPPSAPDTLLLPLATASFFFTAAVAVGASSRASAGGFFRAESLSSLSPLATVALTGGSVLDSLFASATGLSVRPSLGVPTEPALVRGMGAAFAPAWLPDSCDARASEIDALLREDTSPSDFFSGFSSTALSSSAPPSSSSVTDPSLGVAAPAASAGGTEAPPSWITSAIQPTSLARSCNILRRAAFESRLLPGLVAASSAAFLAVAPFSNACRMSRDFPSPSASRISCTYPIASRISRSMLSR